MIHTVKRGLMVGLRVTWTLGKIIFPITLLIALLQHTPILPWIIEKIAPLMNIFGLSGDAAIPLVLGNFLNLYAGIGAILTLDLTVKEVFIIAVMLSFSHSMLIESGVAIKTGVKLWVVLVVRIGLAVSSALVINFVWQGGSDVAQYGLIPSQNEAVVTGWFQIGMDALQQALIGVAQLAIIVFPLMVGIQILKEKKWLDVFAKWMGPVTRSLGMNENTSTTLAAGLLFGLSYGAGVMIQAVREDGVSKKDLTIAFIFLGSCHAVVEDTLIFIPLGIPVLPLLIVRLGIAILLTATVAIIWNKSEVAKARKEITYEQ
ncbi:nucleoside recognition domain-containing protein [Bacillus sp. V3B]|uniref:nucleoside recognition domain-containing protein n=1 Tax=Bacillus sp. V3B TaxID=2804915 RepID=UPI00210CB258|nr:nucleoside recognition domain-containing protein [Bacillus sp. V3B]MCQ6275703.1 nucleoside recognition domain-containing protein [Bacillus sp. V3B]